MSLLIREEYVNTTEGYRFGDSGEPSEAWTDDIGLLFKSLKNEYGRPSKVYIDTKSGAVHHVGWCFTKRMRYEDARTDKPSDYYIREVWVTLYEPCDVNAPQACMSRSANGSVTRHPFTKIDVAAYRKRTKERLR